MTRLLASLVFALAGTVLFAQEDPADRVVYQASFLADPRQPDGPAASYDASLTSVPAGPNYDSELRVLYAGLEPAVYARKAAEEFHHDYDTDVQDLTDDEDAFGSANLNYYFSESVEIVASSMRLRVWQRNTESYWGGAHGAHHVSWIVFDEENGQPISSQDMGITELWPFVQSWVEDDLREQYDVSPGGRLDEEGNFFDPTIDAPSETAPMKDGLELVWNEYEIAPYVMGQIGVTIPWHIVLPHANPLLTELATSWQP